jgi:RNA polymerase sigma-70 factor (ECF subfamily)
MGIASHEALSLSRWRRLRVWQPLLGREAAEQTDEGSPAVWQAVNSLPAAHRACVGLFYLYGFSIDEIAAMLHVPPGTVGSRLHNARHRLRLLLQDTPGETEK